MNNCSNTATTTGNVNPVPGADFAASDVCEGRATFFNNNSSSQGISYLWQFGTGDVPVAANLLYVYP